MQQTKPIMEELARARNYFHRHEVLRSLVSLATAVKAAAQAQLVGRDKSLVENGMIEVVQMLNRTEEVKKFCPAPEGLTQNRGKLKTLFTELMTIINKVREEASKESLEQTRNRKLELDNQLVRGFKFLEGGNLKEADLAFQEAVKNYVDEHKLFHMIGAKLLQAGFARPALKYLLKGLEVDPDPLPLVVVTAQAYASLDEPAKAESLLLQHMDSARDPEAFAVLAQVQVAQQKNNDAIKNAARGLRLDPGHSPSRKLYNQLKKARAKQKQTNAASS